MSGVRQKVLATNIAYFRQQAQHLALDIMPSSTAIQPLLVGEDAKAVAISRQLKDHGILVTAIRPPTVAKGSARLRITLTASHTEKDIDQLLTALVTLLTLMKVESNYGA
jgi:8-amino-7-oxononanoate synthase